MQRLVQPILQPMQEFGPCLRQILKDKKISASELARMMAYKSRNSIFRILDGEGGHGARLSFYDRLMSENPLLLNDEERARLTQALEISRVGPGAFLSNRAIRELLMNVSLEPEMHKVRVEAPDDPHDLDFRNALAAMARGKKAYITIMGCCDRAISDALRECIYKTDASCEVKVTHFVYTGAEEIVQNISAIQPMLYCDRYTAYCVQPGMFGKERERFYRNNCIHAHIQDERGEWYDQSLLLIDKGVFVLMNRSRGEETDPLIGYFHDDIVRMPQLKTVFAKNNGPKNYLGYTEDCRRLEQNRAIYTIKLDVPLSFIHPDILLPCATEGFREMGLADGGALDALMAELERIHLARWENFFTKRKVNHTIFSREAMEHFAQTGLQSDHFFVMRPYTKSERVAIFTHLQKEMTGNPYFHIHFFKDDFVAPPTEIGLYEGVGTLLSKPYTHYDLCGDHAEAIITQEEFCARYKEFYVQDLLERYVISEEETLAVLDRLIEIAKST